MSDLDAILNGEQPTPVEAPVEEPTQSEPEQPVEVEEATAPEPAPQEEPHTVPVAVVSELRGENRVLKERLAQLEQSNQPQAQSQPVPDYIDPEGAGYLQSQIGALNAHMAAEKSELMSRMRHGDDVVDAAMEAAKAANAVGQFAGQQDPWAKLVKWHQTQEVQREVGDDPAAYKARVEAEIRAKVEAEMVAKQAQMRAGTPAPSMANVTGTGGGSAPAWGGPTPLTNILGD